jgi:hypothetical protein
MRGFVRAVGAAVLGGWTTAAIFYVIPHPQIRLSATAMTELALGAAILPLLLIGIHEGGHLMAGALARFTPCLLIVGPLKLERTASGWRVGWNRSFPIFGGLAAAIPRGVRHLRRRMIVVVAGGPGASLVCGLAALAALALSGVTRESTLAGGGAVVFLLTFLFALGSLAVAIAALVPGYRLGFASDGARLLRFLQDTPDVDAEVALIGLIGASMAGQRPREWDPDLLASALRLEAGTPHWVAARMLAHGHALDCGDVARAREHLQSALLHQDLLPRMTLPALLLQAAYFEALHDENPISARRRLADAGPGVLESPQARPLAEAAVLLAEGDPRAAEKALADAVREIPHASDRGSAAMAADQIAELRRIIEEH